MNGMRALKLSPLALPLVALIALAIVGVCTLLDTGGGFTASCQLSKEQRAAIQAQVPLDADEKVLFLYETESNSPNVGFYVFTDRRIGCYQPESDQDS